MLSVSTPKKIKTIDLFCGVGGLTHGFIKAGLQVVAGFDIDKECKFAYEQNNSGASFYCEDVRNVKGELLTKLYDGADIKVLVGCAPCQPFSTYAFKSKEEEKLTLLDEFSRLVGEVKPDIVSMENVPQLEKTQKAEVFRNFVNNLKNWGYHVSYKVVECRNYGVPQHRKRLVLIASKLGIIAMPEATHAAGAFVTVKDTIGHLPPLSHGEQSKEDELHKASKLSPINFKRILASKPGGTWRDWPEPIRLKCHQKSTGKTYVSVYGRMSWDEPAPTMTTQCIGYGNGRFGHPEQDRAITLREASLFQTFPADYKFLPEKSNISTRTLSTHIGNAVPVRLGEVIASQIIKHIQEHG